MGAGRLASRIFARARTDLIEYWRITRYMLTVNALLIDGVLAITRNGKMAPNVTMNIGKHGPEPTAVSHTLPQDNLNAELPRLRRYARVLTGDWHRADDLLLDTLARAWEMQNAQPQSTNLRAWLFSILHNVYLNRPLRWRELAQTPVNVDGGPPLGRQSPVPATQPQQLASNEVMARLWRLPVEQREVLVLVTVEGLRYDEIAALLDVPIGTVISRLTRARKACAR
jgi:RNA polymerase sigma-70 factor, ECF subfamily